LIEDGVPILGVVFAPVLQTIYYGIAHSAERMAAGAWRAGNCAGKSVDEIKASATPCSMRHAPRTAPLRVVASRSHCNEETREFIAALEAEYGEVELVSSGSSLKLCMVAEGKADIYPRIAPTMEWDTAAAHAVVAGAGGRVVKYDSAVPAEAYLTQSAERMEQGDSTPHAPSATPHAPCALRYNKQNLLNPYFVVCGLHG